MVYLATGLPSSLVHRIASRGQHWSKGKLEIDVESVSLERAQAALRTSSLKELA